MRSRRLIKKLSNALAPLYKDAWVCRDDEELYYMGECRYPLLAKGVMHVGGGLDYWGEGQEAYTVLEAAEQSFFGWQSFCGCERCQLFLDPIEGDEPCPISTARLRIRPTFKAIRAALKS